MKALDPLRFGGRTAPVVLQIEAAECGLACLAMVAGAHGLQLDTTALRQRFSVSIKGVTAADLVRMGEAMHLAPRAVRAELDQLPQLQTPCILHWDMSHFVVLVSLKRGVATIHDPASGVRRMKLADLSPHFTGVALEFTPTADFKPADERRSVRLREMLGPVRGIGLSLGQIFVLALVLETFVLLGPFLMQWVVDGVLVSGDRDLLWTLGIGFALLVLIQSATAAARAWAVLVMSAQLNLHWLGNVFGQLLRLPVAWFEKRHVGDVWSRFSSVRQIQRTLTTHFVEAVIDGLLVVLTLAVMAVYSLTLTGVALVAVAAYGAMRWAFFGPQRRAAEDALVFEARQNSHFIESLRGVQAIKLFNAQADRRSRFASLVVATMNADIVCRKLELLFSVSHRVVFGLERVLVIGVGAWLVLEQQLSVGMLFAFVAFRETFAMRVSALIDKGVELRMLRLQGERLADIVLAEPETDGSREASPQRSLDASIELRNVSFRYADGEPDVLKAISFKIEPGESVAIVGPSGGGKTTLLKLMLGLHRPTQGEVLVGGHPLSRIGLAAWRDQIGVVMQDEPLFSGTIADNISFFAPEIDNEWLQQCARVAAVHDEIEAMPMSYLTLVGDMGASLSGGQKQRILLARALYKRPRVLLLDEATSSLDIDRERVVNHSVRKLALTRVIVAHRPETIASASRVIALQDGRIAQDLRSVTGVAPLQ